MAEILNYAPRGRWVRRWRRWFLVAVAVCLIGVCVYALVSLLTPETGVQAHARAVERNCPANLRVIFAAIQKYAAEHGGALPDDLPNLIAEGYLDSPGYLVCLGSNDTMASGDNRKEWAANLPTGTHNSYSYGGRGLRLSSAGVTAIVWDTADGNHRERGRYTLYLDGTVRFVPKK